MKVEFLGLALLVASCSPSHPSIRLLAECDDHRPILKVTTLSLPPETSFYVTLTDIETGANQSYQPLLTLATENRTFRQLVKIDGDTAAIALNRDHRATLTDSRGKVLNSIARTPNRCS